LFNSIAEQIGKEYSQIFYATNSSTADFNEYMVHDNVTGKNYFLDFYIKDNNKVIEFDGDYWHGEKRGN
jgi:very-short-patch-repair endonuclease